MGKNGEWSAKILDSQSVDDLARFLCGRDYESNEEEDVAEAVVARTEAIIAATKDVSGLDILVDRLVHGSFAITNPSQDVELSSKVLFQFIECATSADRLEKISDDVDSSHNDAVSRAYQQKLQSFKN